MLVTQSNIIRTTSSEARPGVWGEPPGKEKQGKIDCRTSPCMNLSKRPAAESDNDNKGEKCEAWHVPGVVPRRLIRQQRRHLRRQGLQKVGSWHSSWYYKVDMGSACNEARNTAGYYFLGVPPRPPASLRSRRNVQVCTTKVHSIYGGDIDRTRQQKGRCRALKERSKEQRRQRSTDMPISMKPRGSARRECQVTDSYIHADTAGLATQQGCLAV